MPVFPGSSRRLIDWGADIRKAAGLCRDLWIMLPKNSPLILSWSKGGYSCFIKLAISQLFRRLPTIE